MSGFFQQLSSPTDLVGGAGEAAAAAGKAVAPAALGLLQQLGSAAAAAGAAAGGAAIAAGKAAVDKASATTEAAERQRRSDSGAAVKDAAARDAAPRPAPGGTVRRRALKPATAGAEAKAKKASGSATPLFGLPFFSQKMRQRTSPPPPPATKLAAIAAEAAQPPAATPAPAAAQAAPELRDGSGSRSDGSGNNGRPAERVETELSFTDERAAAEAAVAVVEEQLGMSVEEWRSRLSSAAAAARDAGAVATDASSDVRLQRQPPSSAAATSAGEAAGQGTRRPGARAAAAPASPEADDGGDDEELETGDAGGQRSMQLQATGDGTLAPGAAGSGGDNPLQFLGGAMRGLGAVIANSNVQARAMCGWIMITHDCSLIISCSHIGPSLPLRAQISCRNACMVRAVLCELA